VFENDSPWLSILILGTSKNHGNKFGDKEPAEAQECTFLPEIHELTALCSGVHCCDEARRIQSSAISKQTHITLFLRISR
jgi:hypothetical protein